MSHHDPNNEAHTESPLSDVEHLLESMSLKAPSQSLDNCLAKLDQPVRRRELNHSRSWLSKWGLATAVGLTCLMTGFLFGRFSNRPLLTDGDSMANALPVAQDNQSAAATANTTTTSQLNVNNENSMASLPDESMTNSKVRLIDEGLYLLDGKIPVRRYVAISEERIQVIDKESGAPIEIVVPVKKSFVQRAYGT